MTLVRLSPYSELSSLREQMKYLMNDFFGERLRTPERETTQDLVFFPPADIKEGNNNLVVTMEIPGVKKDDINIELTDNVLTINGERNFKKEEKGETYHRVERSYGTFSRSFHLPSQLQQDEIDASYKDGILTISIPRAEEAKPKKITIKE